MERIGIIIITGDSVTKIKTDTPGNGHVRIEKLPTNEFFCSRGDETWGRQQTGTFEDILTAFCDEAAEMYKKLFGLINPTEETIVQAGFTGYELVFK